MASSHVSSNCFLHIDNPNLGGDSSNDDPTRTLLFTSMPGELGTTKYAEVQGTSILGRSDTIKTYGSSGPRIWNLELHFYAETEVKKDVEDKINWCESLVYPIYTNEGLSLGLPTIIFVFGDYLNVRCICTNVQTTLPGPWSIAGVEGGEGAISPFNPGKPLYGIANLTLEQLVPNPFGHKDVKSGLHNKDGLSS